jgi:hypothetical protein
MERGAQMNGKMAQKENPAKENRKDSRVFRSPSYPVFDLEEAINKAKILWEKDHKAGSSREAAFAHLGYKGGSGSSLRAVAALKKYGLTEEKQGRICLTDLAIELLLYPPNDGRHQKALREAALKPTIFSRLYEKYKDGIPSDETLKSELIKDEDFHPKHVDNFLADFRKTLAFAGLEPIPPGKQVTDQYSSQPVTKQPSLTQSVQGQLANAFPIPLKRQNQAMISFGSLPLEKADLDLLKKWIDLMAENLTEAPNQQQTQ